MKFGLWDHVDNNGLAIADLLENRLEFVKAADAAGFYSYHISEHHATPLNVVPVPGVYLGAVARETKTMRMGPLCYLLPLYSPLRLIEEICILDHLSRGRLDVGVGRGVSPYELNYHNVDPETSREVFEDALDAIHHGLTHDRLNHQGKHFSYSDVPMELKPYQSPVPAIWYPSSNEVASAWAGERGYHYVTLGATEAAQPRIKAFKAGFFKGNGALTPLIGFDGGAAIGIMRHMVIAETEKEAMAVARPAYNLWYANLTKLQRENVNGPNIVGFVPPDLESAMKAGSVLVGTPAHIREKVAEHSEVLGINYLICGFYFGNIEHAHALQSLNLFSGEIAPAFY